MNPCRLEKNQAACPCSYPCDRKGLCCECLRYHQGRRELPACYFPGEAERTYDRSIEHFLRITNNKR